MIRKSAGFTRRNRNVTISNGNATKLPHRFHRSLAVSPVVAALWAARFAQRSGYRNCYAKSSIFLFEFAQQLLLQMSPRSLFDRATLGGYPLLLRLTFVPCSRFHRLRHVPDLWPARADVSLFWFCVRIHECLALVVGHKK